MSAPEHDHCPHCFATNTTTSCLQCGWRAGLDNPHPALVLGTVLDGRYRIGRVLGHGGFGITYLAWDENLHLRLAIKEYLPRDTATRAPDGVSMAIYSGPAGEQFAFGLDRFLEEARTLARFDQHPGIVTVKNFFRAHGTGYCVMDYVEGITLRQYLEQQPSNQISVDAALQLLMPVMDALRAVHKAGMLHRDIAPDNIYLTQDGRIKLLDFGAARFAAGEHSRSLSIILKPGYAPEEQYRTKGKQGPWTDVYGLGATFYRAITGTVPPEALDRMEEDDLIPPSRLSIAIQPGQEATLLKAMEVKAGLRFQSIAEFQQAWHSGHDSEAHRAAGRGEISQPPAVVVQTPVSQEKGKTRRDLAVAGLAVILAPLVGSVLWQWSQEPMPKMAETPRPSPTATAPTVPAGPAVPSTSATNESPPSVVASAPVTGPGANTGTNDATPTQTPAESAQQIPIYFAAEVPPTDNIPPEAPLCYRFMVSGLEEQLGKLKTKYPALYDDKILTNNDGSKTLLAKRRDDTGKEIAYFYSTSALACNNYANANGAVKIQGSEHNSSSDPDASALAVQTPTPDSASPKTGGGSEGLPSSWDSCADNVRSWMYTRNECGVSDCSNEFGNLGQNIVKKCGYPKRTNSDIAQIIRDARVHCRIKDNRADMSGYLKRTLDFFPPTHPIHKKVLDQCFKNR